MVISDHIAFLRCDTTLSMVISDHIAFLRCDTTLSVVIQDHRTSLRWDAVFLRSSQTTASRSHSRRRVMYFNCAKYMRAQRSLVTLGSS